jgi:hypothetical protein
MKDRFKFFTIYRKIMYKGIPPEKLLIKAFHLKCKGSDEDGRPFFQTGSGEDAIVEVYKDGHSEVICRYRQGKIQCNLCGHPDDRDNGICVYLGIPQV